MGPRDLNVCSSYIYMALIAIIYKHYRIKTIIYYRQRAEHADILKGCEHAIDDKTCGSWRTYIFESPRQHRSTTSENGNAIPSMQHKQLLVLVLERLEQ